MYKNYSLGMFVCWTVEIILLLRCVLAASYLSLVEMEHTTWTRVGGLAALWSLLVSAARQTRSIWK